MNLSRHRFVFFFLYFEQIYFFRQNGIEVEQNVNYYYYKLKQLNESIRKTMFRFPANEYSKFERDSD